jgi:tetratricopeptide (TPR) repeat protein
MGYKTDYCRASVERYFDNDSDIDALLADGRECGEASTSSSQEERKSFDALLPVVYQGMAWALNSRGVFSEALNNARNAVSLDSKNATAFYEQSRALSGLQRVSESISAAEEAVRLSDGKYYSFEEQLGDAYFDAERWQSAQQAYERAAAIDRTSFSAAFNAALSLQRQSYFGDAREWYQKAIERAASPEQRARAMSQLQSLR